jgi:hypothetical protein
MQQMKVLHMKVLHKHLTETECVAQVSVYTFGAPRVGNHAFARVYEKAVPDTWHVINDQVQLSGILLAQCRIVAARISSVDHRCISGAMSETCCVPGAIDIDTIMATVAIASAMTTPCCGANTRFWTVPCLWCVAMVQDTVPRGGKLISAYKRNGQRVIVNKIGDIVVSLFATGQWATLILYYRCWLLAAGCWLMAGQQQNC